MARTSEVPKQHSGSSPPLICAAAAANIVAYLKRYDVDPEPILRQAGVDAGMIDNPYNSILLSTFTELLDIAAEITNNPSAGLELGSTEDPANWGAVGFLLLNAPTAWTCLKAFERYMGSWQRASYSKVMRDDDFLRAEHSIFHPSVRRRDQDAEFRMSFVVNHLRRTTRKPVAPVYATFMHRQIGKMAAYERYLGIKPVFGSDVNALYYKAQVADLENPAADPRLFSVVNRHLEDLEKELPEAKSLLHAVEDQVRMQLAGSPPTLSQIGKSLTMQQRTLQRYLEKQGVSFTDIVERVRLEEARRYLEDTDIKMKEIAYYLGFSDPSAFIKAFRRWTGMTPLKYRQRDPKEDSSEAISCAGKIHEFSEEGACLVDCR